MFEITPYSDLHRKDIVALMGALPFKERIWHWQFEENPFGHRFDPVVLTRAGRVAGFNGVMPIDVLYDGERISALWSCDFFVDGAYRRQGLGKRIKEALIEKSELIAAFGISNLAAPVLLKMGWHSSGEVGVFRKYRSFDSLRKIAIGGLQLANAIGGVVERPRGKAQEVILADALPEKRLVDGLWERVGGSYRKIVVRNHDYLHWRYERHPLARYRFAHVYAGRQLEAIGVYRESGANAQLVDMLCEARDGASRDRLVTAIARLYPDSSRCGCITSDRLLAASLRRHAFFRTREEIRFFVRSARPADSACESGWFIMTGDSDGELLEAAAGMAGDTADG